VRGTLSGNQIVVVGLGNPGNGYSRHRHNIGFAVVDELAAKHCRNWASKREKAQVCRTRIDNASVVLVKPMTFMNLSGMGVLPVLRRLNADPARMIVVHDDMDLPAGRVRIKVGGGDGGHKGIRSIADSLRFHDFIRVRLGIGRPPAGVPPEEFVLSAFTPEEGEVSGTLIRTGVAAIGLLVLYGVGHAQNVIHSSSFSTSNAG
jgi:PTH1 family peptidyl-tRNA hydrolase